MISAINIIVWGYIALSLYLNSSEEELERTKYGVFLSLGMVVINLLSYAD
jgi:hypothetical protein